MHNMYPIIHFRAKITLCPFGMLDKGVWWGDHKRLSPLLRHINELSETIFLVAKEDNVDCEIYQADDDCSMLVLNSTDSMFVREDADPHGETTLYIAWIYKVGDASRILDVIREWDSRTNDVVTRADGIGAVTCDIHSSVDLGLRSADSSDAFDEADDAAFRLVCR